jgi:hypothetical protein
MRVWGLAVLAAGMFVQASPAVAATVERDDVDAADVTFVAAPGEANRVVVRAEPEGIRFTDTGAVISTRTCTLVIPHEAFCAGIAETLIVETGDGDDSLAATIADTGRDRRDSISVTTCRGVRRWATRGARERSGRYTWPGGFVRFSGLDGVLPCG